MSEREVCKAHKKAKAATRLFSLAILIFSVSIVYSVFVARDHRLDICREVEKVKAQIYMTVDRSNKSLPSIAYFREHPVELEAALRQNQRTLKTFAPGHCK